VIQALASETVIYFIIFACYLLAIQGVVMSFARYSSQRSVVKTRLQTDIGTARIARAAQGSRRKSGPLRQDLANSIVRAGLSPKSWFVPICSIGGGLAVLLPLLVFGLPLWVAGLLAPAAAVAAPVIGLKIMRIRYLRAFEAQLPEAIDTLIRSLRAGHPVSASLRLVRNLPAPIGEAFAIVSDEVTYGLDLETAMKNLQVRLDQQDVALLVSAISLQVKTGGNLAELLERLSKVIRERQRMRLKARALSAEARFSAIALSVLPLLLFAVLQFVAPGFYGSIWSDWLVVPTLAIAALWLVIGNIIMFRMVRFDI
jgi:tight adherence protein B